MWHFLGFFEHSKIHGPLPVKRWIKSKSDKRHKLSYKFSYKRTAGEGAAEYNDRRAIEYARWLAVRDGVTIGADMSAQIYHDFVRIPGQKSQQRRARYVEFGNSSRDSRWNQTFSAKVRIDIPNWDFVPAEPTEETIGDNEQMQLAA